MQKSINWFGMTGAKEPTRAPSSMLLVDYYNVQALRNLGWEVQMGPNPNRPSISFFHQGHGPVGKPSFHYSCTSSICTLPTATEAAEKGHALVFTLNSLMTKNFTRRGINAKTWPHGVADMSRFDGLKKYDKFTIVNVAQGQFGPDKSIKGITELLAAVHGMKNVQLIQIGATWPPDATITIKGQGFRLGNLAPQIRFLGILPHEDTLQIMARSHLMVSLSVGEGCPLPSCEALGLGLPVLSTDLPYTHDWPFHDVVRKIPSVPFLDVSYLHNQPFAPRNLDAYTIRPFLYRPKDAEKHIHEAVADKAWHQECEDYKTHARQYASWEKMLKTYALPAIEAAL